MDELRRRSVDCLITEKPHKKKSIWKMLRIFFKLEKKFGGTEKKKEARGKWKKSWSFRGVWEEN